MLSDDVEGRKVLFGIEECVIKFVYNSEIIYFLVFFFKLSFGCKEVLWISKFICVCIVIC